MSVPSAVMSHYMLPVCRTGESSVAGRVLGWLQAALPSSHPLTITIHISAVILLLTFIVRIVTCCLPNCNK